MDIRRIPWGEVQAGDRVRHRMGPSHVEGPALVWRVERVMHEQKRTTAYLETAGLSTVHFALPDDYASLVYADGED